MNDVPSPCPERTERAELAENTMTAPAANRQRVAVIKMLCSIGWGWRRRAIRPLTSRRLPECLPADLEVLELVPRGAGGGEQDHVAGTGGSARGGHGDVERAAVVQRDAGALER